MLPPLHRESPENYAEIRTDTWEVLSPSSTRIIPRWYHFLLPEWGIAGHRPLKAVQKLLESRTVLSWGNEGGFFVAVTVDLEKVLGRKGFLIHFPAKLKRNNGILAAVED